MYGLRVACSILVTLGFAPFQATAQTYEFSGHAAVEGRWFPQSPAAPFQFSGTQLSVIAEPAFKLQTNSDLTLRFTPFARLDSRDDDRSHFDIREASAETTLGKFDILFGVSKVFWGVTESRHLVNIINQIDLREGADEEDFLGQPMIRIGIQEPWGHLEGFVMTGFRERRQPSRKARLRPLLKFRDHAEFENSARHAGVDVAARYTQIFGDWDIAGSVFHGTSREPQYRRRPDESSFTEFYSTIVQSGVEVQYTHGGWLWKFEGIYRKGHGRPFGAMVTGFEKTHYQLFGGRTDVGLIAEYLFDDRDDTAPATPFDNDIFLGARLALNDTQDTTLLGGAVIDVKDGTTSFRLEGQRRIGTDHRIDVEVQLFGNVDKQNALNDLRKDSYLLLTLSRFF